MSRLYFDIMKIAQNGPVPGAPGQNPAQPPIQPVPAAPQAPVNDQPPVQPPEQPPVQPPVQPPQGQQNAQPEGNRKPIYFVEEQNYGVSWKSIIVQAPGIDNATFKKLKTLANNYILSCRRPDGGLPTWATWANPQGKLVPAWFKLFANAKDRPQGFFSIGITERRFFEQLLQELQAMGFDTSRIQGFLAPQQAEGQGDENAAAALKPVQVSKPSWDVILLKFEKNGDVINFNKNEKIGGRWDPAEMAWRFALRGPPPILPSRLESLAEFMRQKGYDVAEFIAAIKEYKRVLEENKENLKDPEKTIVVRDISANTKFLLAISFPRTPTLKAEMEEFVKFSFPSKGDLTDLQLALPQRHGDVLPPQLKQLPNGRYEPTGMRLEQGNAWYVYGRFDEIYRYASLVKSRGWDVTNIRNVMGAMLQRGIIERTRYPGELDGYEVKDENGRQKRDAKGNPVFDYEKFYKDTEAAVPGAELFPKQKDGIRWLYERDSAILGDKTGTGKTLSTLAAAKMRLDRSGGRCLIITLNATQLQWANEIVNKLGEDRDQITFNPADAQKRWVIITYPNISAQPQYRPDGSMILNQQGAPVLKERWRSKQAVLNGICSTDFTILIMDEAHLLKNESSSVAKIVNVFASKIPFKWAASATSVANTAIDVHNVLKVTNHTLGAISSRDFTKEFVGRKATIKDFEDKQKAKEILALQEERAYNLRKWLTLSGAYLSRSQKSINPNIPDHNIGENFIEEANFDMAAFRQELDQIRERYGHNAGAALASLTKQRVKISELKVPHTIARAKEVIDRGEKILVFSNFRNSCKRIVAELNTYLKTIDPDYGVVTIMGDDQGEDILRAVEEFKDPEGQYRAMVISAKKGGTGVSLENSTQHVIMNDFDWSPYVAEQTEGRAFRINNVMPVNTEYMVVRGENGRLNPDEIFYKFVRTKIRIANIIQNLDAEAEEYILNGFNDAMIQKEIAKARQADRDADIELGHNIKELFDQEGIDFGAQAEDQLALDFEDENDRRQLDGEDDEDIEGDNRIASSWLERAKFS